MERIVFNHSDSKLSIVDQSFKAVCNDSAVKLVSPYVSLDYLEKHLLKRATAYLLILNLNEFLPKTKREKANRHIAFLERNRNRIKHNEHIHAKAIIGEKSAIFGSFNLTFAGAKQNHELGLFTNDQKKLKELIAWFEKIWEQSEPVTEQTITRLQEIQSLRSDLNLSKSLSLPFRFARPKHTLLPTYAKRRAVPVVQNQENNALAVLLKRTSPRFRRLLKKYVRALSLSNPDERIVWTLRKGIQLSLTLNFGYVLVLKILTSGQIVFRVSLPKKFVQANKQQLLECEPWNKMINGKRMQNFWCRIDLTNPLVFSDEFLNAWIECSETYLAYGVRSSHRRHHQNYIMDFLRP